MVEKENVRVRAIIRERDGITVAFCSNLDDKDEDRRRVVCRNCPFKKQGYKIDLCLPLSQYEKFKSKFEEVEDKVNNVIDDIVKFILGYFLRALLRNRKEISKILSKVDDLLEGYV